MVSPKKQRRKTLKRRKSFMLSAHNNDAQYARRRGRKKVMGVFTKIKNTLAGIKKFRWVHLWNAVFGIMACFVLFALASPYFNLEKIKVTGDTYALNPTEIEASLKDLYGKNMLFITDENVRAILNQTFPEFAEIDITETWPDTLELSITVSEGFMTLINDENASTAVVTKDGVVLPIPPQESLTILKVAQYPSRFQARSTVLEGDMIRKIFEAQQFFEESIELDVREIMYLWAAQELHIVTTSGSVIWLDLQEPIKEQIIKLQYGKDEIGLYQNQFEHIDLRIPKQLIWKKQP